MLRFGAGLGLLSYLVFALGMARLLVPPALIGVLLAGLACAVMHARELIPRQAVSQSRWRVALFVVVALGLAAPLILQPLYPPSDWDATSFHLAAAKLYLQSHRLVVATYLRYPVFPQFQEMLFTLAMGVFDDVTAHLVSFSQWIGCALALVALGRRLGDPVAGLCAAGLWLGGPTGLSFGSNAYVDVGLTFYVTLSILAWLAFAQTGRFRWAALAGAMVGSAAAIKYFGLFFLVALGFMILLQASRGARARAVGIYLALAIATSLPWYARVWAISGDPLFPFLGQVFGTRFWNAADLHWQMVDFHSHNLGTTPLDFVRLWDRLAFNQGLFVGPEDLFSPALWIPLPLLLVALWKRSHDRTLLLLALSYVPVWFLSSQSGRYLLPVIPILCLALGRVLSGGLGAIRRHAGEVAPANAGAAAWALAALLALPGSWYALDHTRARGMPPFRPEERRKFLTRTYPSYPAYEWLNRTRGRDYRVYAWRDGALAYFADGQCMGEWFGPYRYWRIESALPDGAAVYRALRSMHADYWVVPQAIGPVCIPDDSTFRSHVHLVHADPGARIFAVDDSTGDANRDPWPD